MPLPASIIIGTTLAIVGSGYVFKKFIYDPHLGPFLEALLASHHHSLPSSPSSQRYTDPISIPSVGSSTATRGHHTRLTRRNTKQSSRDYELLDQQPIITEDDRRRSQQGGRRSTSEDDWRRSPLPSGSVRKEVKADIDDTWDRPSSYDLQESVLTPPDLSCQSGPSLITPPRRNSFTVEQQPLIDLDPTHFPQISHDDEICSVIYDHTPTRTGSSTPAYPSTNPHLPPGGSSPDIHASPSLTPIPLTAPDQFPNMEESTTFSFLSLLQISSPMAANAALSEAGINFNGRADDSTHAAEGDRWAESNLASQEDDMVSLSTSGYEDAETYSPGSRMSPVRIQSALPPTRSPMMPALLRGDSAIEECGLTSILPAIGPMRRRGSMSVVSMSESESEREAEEMEGWMSEAVERDWEAARH